MERLQDTYRNPTLTYRNNLEVVEALKAFEGEFTFRRQPKNLLTLANNDQMMEILTALYDLVFDQKNPEKLWSLDIATFVFNALSGKTKPGAFSIVLGRKKVIIDQFNLDNFLGDLQTYQAITYLHGLTDGDRGKRVPFPEAIRDGQEYDVLTIINRILSDDDLRRLINLIEIDPLNLFSPTEIAILFNVFAAYGVPYPFRSYKREYVPPVWYTREGLSLLSIMSENELDQVAEKLRLKNVDPKLPRVFKICLIFLGVDNTLPFTVRQVRRIVSAGRQTFVTDSTFWKEQFACPLYAIAPFLTAYRK